MIHIYSSSSNLGDNLGYTCLADFDEVIIHMYDDAGCRAVGKIFENVAQVVYDNGSPEKGSPKSNDPTHINLPVGQRHLLALNIQGCSIPKIKLTPEELKKGQEFASQFKNPCIIKCSPQVTDSRTPPLEIFENIIKKNPDVTFLNFGLSKNHPKHNFSNLTVDGIKSFYDFDIREQAAIYAAVGRYIGPDTGDYHLMLAVGGVCDVFVPANSPVYSYARFHYNNACWNDERVRVKYHYWFAEISALITELKFK